MKIFIDIGHPAHVHYFKNFISIMKNDGHKILVTARNKEMAQYLLEKNRINYTSRGNGAYDLLGRLFYLIKADYLLFIAARRFNPDLFLSFASPYTAHVSSILRKPNIVFDDTENAGLNHKFYAPFSDIICTPLCFNKDFGKKQIRFDGYMELCYLHPNYFKPDISVLNILKVRKNEKFVIVRFVAWKAGHDIGHEGISPEMKVKIVKELSKYAKVFISSEKDLPDSLKQYQIQIPQEKMHDVLYYAALLFGESATMASECAVLGTPAIFLDNNGRGYTDEEEKTYHLVFNYSESKQDQELSMKKAVAILQESNIKQEWQKKRNRMISDKIDVTAFMVWFVKNYPESVVIMKQTPEYQYNFR